MLQYWDQAQVCNHLESVAIFDDVKDVKLQ